MSFASCPCLRAYLFVILYVCLSFRPCQKWVVSGLWHSLPSSYDFRFLSKRGNWRHPIFDQPQDLDVIVWSLDDHPCSCLFWVPKCLGCAPCLKISQLVCFVLGCGPSTCDFASEGRGWLVGHPCNPSAKALFHRPCFLAIDHKYWPIGTLFGRSAIFSGRDLSICFLQIFCASCNSWWAHISSSIHVYGGIESRLKLVQQAWELNFYKKGDPSPFPEVLKIEIQVIYIYIFLPLALYLCLFVP